MTKYIAYTKRPNIVGEFGTFCINAIDVLHQFVILSSIFIHFDSGKTHTHKMNGIWCLSKFLWNKYFSSKSSTSESDDNELLAARLQREEKFRQELEAELQRQKAESSKGNY